MAIAFRTDASIDIGTGHVMRCLTLADSLKATGAKCRFICREHPGHLLRLIRDRGHEAVALALPAQKPLSISSEAKGNDALGSDTTKYRCKSEPDETEVPAHATWLGTDRDTDAEQTLEAIGNEPVDWLIVDHYALDDRWECRLRAACNRLMVIDDLADRAHDGDLLLDQNYARNPQHRYDRLQRREVRALLGPRYALLRPEYVWQRQAIRARDGHVQRVLVFFGGTDADDLTGRTLDALSDPSFGHLQVDLIVGMNYDNRDAMARRVASRPNTRLHSALPTLAGLMAQADLAIGGGGATTWERCCLGLPSLVIGIAENQYPACEALAADGIIHYLGRHDRVDAGDLRDAIGRLMTDPDRLRMLSRLGMELVDGLGPERVTQAMLEMTEG